MIIRFQITWLHGVHLSPVAVADAMLLGRSGKTGLQHRVLQPADTTGALSLLLTHAKFNDGLKSISTTILHSIKKYSLVTKGPGMEQVVQTLPTGSMNGSWYGAGRTGTAYGRMKGSWYGAGRTDTA
jgi:hypothetical protein